ncbi:MAG TPA: RidA family protein [Candidatus Copromorpha excrementipullorum]|uniref:RidA family protein n=1 Tax=Candidatus Allocopromorpha excrementipullorum TaxID=2840743 RepID=A0A9D1N7T3_9FIRM|nr:RidA family protein [Candidatus Copromorpha excrementipullorum]
MNKIHTEKAPAAVGPYSQAVEAGGMIYTSGQIPLDPESGQLVDGDIKQQADRAIKNVIAVLEAAGTSADKVIKTMCFLADMDDFADFNEIYAGYFTEKPARSCVAVKSLPKGALCEIEVIAIR